MEAPLAPIDLSARGLAGRRVLVVGLGRSGRAAMRFAAARGAHVVATDSAPESALGDTAAAARAIGAELHLGGSRAELADGADVVIVSPGVRLDTPVIARARARAIPVWSEIELAARHARGRVVGITGSNGKSTVTTMVGAMFAEAGLPHTVGGNLGIPWTDLLDDDTPQTTHVLELSSFQLETTCSLHANVAVILNLTPDHLDRYRSLDEYAAAKARLLDLQSPGAPAVLNADDPESHRFAEVARGPVHRFSARGVAGADAVARDGKLVLRVAGSERTALDRSELPLAGEHNTANALAALLAATLAGCPVEPAARALRKYRALPHRLAHVTTIRGVAFYDDSKATNPDSAAVALTAFPRSRVHLILGGRDKGGDWKPLLDVLRHRDVRVLLVGEAADLIRDLVGRSAPTIACGTIARAVEAAFDAAAAGDVVLLAPGCASFDQYTDYAARGDDFARAVQALAGGSADA